MVLISYSLICSNSFPFDYPEFPREVILFTLKQCECGQLLSNICMFLFPLFFLMSFSCWMAVDGLGAVPGLRVNSSEFYPKWASHREARGGGWRGRDRVHSRDTCVPTPRLRPPAGCAGHVPPALRPWSQLLSRGPDDVCDVCSWRSRQESETFPCV